MSDTTDPRHEIFSGSPENTDQGDQNQQHDRLGAVANGPIDLARIERAVREILLAMGEDPDRDGLLRTPARVAAAYSELFGGLREDPRRHLQVTFDEDHREMVILRDIPFAAMCEHHLLPFTGHAHVGYIPQGRVVGLSKLARLWKATPGDPNCRSG